MNFALAVACSGVSKGLNLPGRHEGQVGFGTVQVYTKYKQFVCLLPKNIDRNQFERPFGSFVCLKSKSFLGASKLAHRHIYIIGFCPWP